MLHPIERPVCDRCKDKGTAVCNDCPAGMAYDAAEQRQIRVELKESKAIIAFHKRKKMQKTLLNLKSGRHGWR